MLLITNSLNDWMITSHEEQKQYAMSHCEIVC